MADEALGVGHVGCLEHASALELNPVCAVEVDVGRGVEAKTRVAVLVVIPTEEALTERAAVLDRAEAPRCQWPWRTWLCRPSGKDRLPATSCCAAAAVTLTTGCGTSRGFTGFADKPRTCHGQGHQETPVSI